MLVESKLYYRVLCKAQNISPVLVFEIRKLCIWPRKKITKVYKLFFKYRLAQWVRAFTPQGKVECWNYSRDRPKSEQVVTIQLLNAR